MEIYSVIDGKERICAFTHMFMFSQWYDEKIRRWEQINSWHANKWMINANKNE